MLLTCRRLAAGHEPVDAGEAFASDFDDAEEEEESPLEDDEEPASADFFAAASLDFVSPARESVR